MLIPLKDVINKYDLDIKGVIQVGAHYAEEHDIFVQLGVKNIVYIEPCKDAYEKMLTHIWGDFVAVALLKFENHERIASITDGGGIITINTACGNEDTEIDMFTSNDNQGQSNSLLKPELHLRQHPEVRFTSIEKVKVIPLDKLTFKKENYNLLMMDVQGAEGLVLKGATETLKHIDIIYTEVNRGQTYEGNMEIDEMDEFLQPFGFERVETYWPSPNWTWGDAIYIKNHSIHRC